MCIQGSKVFIAVLSMYARVCSELVFFRLSAHTASGFAFPTFFQHVINMPQSKYEYVSRLGRLGPQHWLPAWAFVRPSKADKMHSHSADARTTNK